MVYVFMAQGLVLMVEDLGLNSWVLRN